MRSIYLGLLAVTLALPQPSSAQSGAPASGNTAAASDTAQPAPKKKKGGLFGKMKSLTQNKVVQQVAKTAACNMVPGGQLVAGALDNAAAKKAAKNAAQNAVKNAAKDAVTGAALGAVAGKQSTCGPGMGLMGKGGGAGLVGAVAGAGVPGVGVPGLPTTGLTGAALSAQQLKQTQEQYGKMGLNPAQIQAMQQQMTASPGAGISPDQMKQMMEQYQKMGMDPAQLQAMQQMMAGMNPAIATGPAAAAPAAEAIPTPKLKKEKNRIELRQLPWLTGSESIRPGAEETFAGGIQSLAMQLQPGTRHYKIEVKVEDQGSTERSQLLAQQRAAVVLSFLVAQGIAESRLVIADGGADKDARVVVSENKSGK
jgi:outer membrane protein OmpA-like peptidoglycan-associated protein